MESVTKSPCTIVDEAEEWRDIPGCEGIYQVSSLGRFKDCVTGLRHARPGRNGYVTYAVTRANIGMRSIGVHRAVAWAFLGPQLKGMYVCHNNGNPSDNRLTNLRYGTARENAKDKVHHKTQPRGTTSYKAKLTEDDVKEIRRDWKNYSLASFATKFGVGIGTIRDVILNRTWTHVPYEGAVRVTELNGDGRVIVATRIIDQRDVQKVDLTIPAGFMVVQHPVTNADILIPFYDL